jgi:hypothetical protein
MVAFLPELTNRIIDQLADDTAALTTCGLVCRQWFPRTRVHLFCGVALQVGEGILDDYPDNVETFFALVDASFFDILASVRRLYLSYRTEDSVATTAHLLRFAPCSRLTSLTLALEITGPTSTADILPPLHAQLALVGPKFPCLSKFSLTFGRSPLHGLLGILACVPTIETLYLHGVGIHVIESSALIPPFPQHLRILDVNLSEGAGLLFDHLISLHTIPQLQSLRFSANMEPEAYTAIGRYLHHVGAGLQTLHMMFWRSPLGKLFLVSSVLHA